MMSNINQANGDNKIQRWTVALFSVLVVLSFALSYDALHQIAQLNGKSDWRSWLWPLLIDGALIIFSLYIVYSIRRGIGQTRRYWWLVGVFTGLTILFNVLSGVQHIGLRVVVAAIPPIVLFCAFETLMSMLRATAVQSEAVTVQVSKADKPLTVQPEPVKPVAVQSEAAVTVQPELTDRQRKLLATVQDDPSVSVAELARLLDVSRTTANGDVKRLTSDGLLSKNGNGWKVRY